MRETLVELIALFCVLSLPLVFLLSDADGVHSVELFVHRAVNYGELLVPHVGWFFGLLVSTLLGFYVLLIGNQISGVGEESISGLRRGLGLAAEALVVSAMPVVVALCAYVIHRPDEVALLFVVVPAAAIVLLLGLKLGGFVAFDRNEKLRQLNYRANRAIESIHRIGSAATGSKRAALMRCGAAHVTVCIIASLAVNCASNSEIGIFRLAVASIVATVTTGIAYILLRYAQLSSNSRIDTAIFFLLMLVMTLIFASTGLNLAFQGDAVGAAVVLVPTGLWQISSIICRADNWITIRGLSANSIAARFAIWQRWNEFKKSIKESGDIK